MAEKNIKPISPAAAAAEAKTTEVSSRKTAGASGRFRKLASVRFGRKASSFRGA